MRVRNRQYVRARFSSWRGDQSASASAAERIRSAACTERTAPCSSIVVSSSRFSTSARSGTGWRLGEEEHVDHRACGELALAPRDHCEAVGAGQRQELMGALRAGRLEAAVVGDADAECLVAIGVARGGRREGKAQWSVGGGVALE